MKATFTVVVLIFPFSDCCGSVAVLLAAAPVVVKIAELIVNGRTRVLRPRAERQVGGDPRLARELELGPERAAGGLVVG
jgi:hypothetical protein